MALAQIAARFSETRYQQKSTQNHHRIQYPTKSVMHCQQGYNQEHRKLYRLYPCRDYPPDKRQKGNQECCDAVPKTQIFKNTSHLSLIGKQDFLHLFLLFSGFLPVSQAQNPTSTGIR